MNNQPKLLDIVRNKIRLKAIGIGVAYEKVSQEKTAFH